MTGTSAATSQGVTDPRELDALVGADAAATLRAAAATVSTSGALAVLGATGAFAAVAGTALAAELTGVEDLRVFSPEGGQWKVDELAAVIDAASLRPMVRSVLVVTDADRLGALGVTRLLKTIEEPPAPALFVLCAAARASLPAPLLGRLDATVRIPPRPRADVAARLVGAGADPAAVAQLLDAFATVPELAEVVASGHETSLAKVLDELGCILDLDADADPGLVDLAAVSRLGSSARVDRRVAVDVALTRFEQHARAKLTVADPDGVTLVDAIDKARSLADRHAPLASVLLTVLARPRATRGSAPS